MREVAILGAGELGGALAHVLARREVARTIRLVDGAGRVAEGKALDIAQSAPVEGFAARMHGATELIAIGGADIVVLADRLKEGEPEGEAGLALLRETAAIAPHAVIVCAGAGARALVERGVRELKVRRERLFGTAPEALASAVRASVALEINGSAADVALAVAGVPPAHIVVPWNDMTVAGLSAERMLDEVTRRRIAARLPALWPPGPYALAAAAARAIEAMSGRSRRLASAFVAPDTAAGTRRRAAAMPVRFDAGGIAEVVAPSLTTADRVALENAVLL